MSDLRDRFLADLYAAQQKGADVREIMTPWIGVEMPIEMDGLEEGVEVLREIQGDVLMLDRQFVLRKPAGFVTFNMQTDAED